jgi:DNA polymerase-3 subunit epsilon/CBS domain-containing protein
MKPATGATPLIALDAVAIDTETTGLDTAKARIVQIGAIVIFRGLIGEREPLDLLVDPGIAIPSASTHIHGITNAMVRNAPDFAVAADRLRGFIHGRVVIGHSIGFDVAVLEQESKRAGIPWHKPRSLCVRLLASVAKPNLPDYSLDAIAAGLGIAITGRHSALGDATAAAAIFIALLPKLQEKGIRTLAEAERACRALTSELEKGHRAGWAEPVLQPQAPAWQAVDPYAYRHRIGDLMSHPPVVVRSSAPVRDVIALMVERKISSVFVVDSGEAGRPAGDYGIVTERDMMRRIAADGEQAFSLPVGSFASRPLASIRTAAFAYRAIGRMNRLKIRHLAVRNEDGTLAGIVSARDLLRLRASAAIHLDDAIEDAASAGELATAWATLPAVTSSLVAEGIDARIVSEIVSEELCAVTRRAVHLAEQAMLAEGHGVPPCPYALMVLGSGGRGESLLAADQDNAIVFTEGEPGGLQDRWFAALGTKIADLLDTSGVPYCKGGVMAKNAEFRGSTALWKSRISGWVRRSRPEDLLNVDIFFDLRPVHGDPALATELLEHAHDLGHAEPDFAKLLGEQIVTGNPFTLFGGLRLENGRIDLKKHGLFPIVAAARTLAIRHGIRARSTKARLGGLIDLGIGGDADMKSWLSGHAFLLSLMLAQQSADLHAGIPVSNRVETRTLDRAVQAELKSVLKTLQPVPDVVRGLMFG